MISTLFVSLNTDISDCDQEVLNDVTQQNNEQPILIVMQKTMPIFRQLAELWIDELEVLEVESARIVHTFFLVIYFEFSLSLSLSLLVLL